MRCSNPRREPKLSVLKHYLYQIGQTEATLGAAAKGKRAASKSLRALMGSVKAVGRAGRKCAGVRASSPGTSLIRR